MDTTPNPAEVIDIEEYRDLRQSDRLATAISRRAKGLPLTAAQLSLLTAWARPPRPRE